MKSLQRYRSLWERKKHVYRWLYELTYSSCGACAETGCACKDRICQHVEEQTKARGFTLPHGNHPVLRFIGTRGCVVPPHLRETCTIFICEKAKHKPQFDRLRYQRLITLSEKIEIELMQLEDAQQTSGRRHRQESLHL